ncbi:1-phosphofructokinase [Olsenella uli]|uniref:1-phosphofructokinase n=1 Tax=Olsenella uli TaxID=133926 RepID=UPI001956ABD6|nr:1-phosphofructokinase [Olsenella uli]MBM6676499.1 1-phosphofructokinase [Olsenella uli]
MIYTVTLNPALDKTVHIPNFTLDVVNRITELRRDAGGKGINVSKVIAKLGGTSEAVAVLSGDTGSWIAGALKEAGIRVKAFPANGETRTNLKVIDPEQGTHTDINEPGPEVTDAMLKEMLDVLAEEVSEGDFVVLSGSLPAGVDRGTYGTWTRTLRHAGAHVYLDADGDALEAGLKGKPFFTKPNNHELSALVGRELTTVDEIAAAARELVEKGVERVVVSMGGEGALLATADETWHASSVQVPVGSTVGAGDSVVAAFVYADAQGLGIEDSLRLAMATGAANVMESGTQAAERSVVDGLVDRVEITRLA